MPDKTPPSWCYFYKNKVESIGRARAGPSDDRPAIILPTAPTDEEKYFYAKPHRGPLFVYDVLLFLITSAGLWFFATSVSTGAFFWLGVTAALVQLQLIMSFAVDSVGKSFDLNVHDRLLAGNPLTVEPSVDIYLPCCKEPLEILENTYKYISQLEYINHQVHVLDDGGMDSVKQLAERYGFNYISRDNKPYMCKAGNLRYAFARTSGVFFAIFDADFCPRSDFLGSLLPYMMQHHDVAIVQSPQFFRQLANQTWAEQGGGGTLERYYRVTQVNHDHWGAPGCVGSNAIYRRAALHATGGVVEIGYSEDIHTGFYALSHGWRVKYVPLALACGISPDTPKAYFKQQMRWCTGSLLLLTDLNFWKSNPTLIQKFCYLRGMMSYFVALLELVFGPFHQSLLVWLAPDSVPGYNIIYAIPSLVMSVIYILVVYRTWSGQRYNLNINCVSVIRQAGYMMAVKDYIFGTNVAWVPAGALQSKGDILDEVGRKDDGNHKYHHMRIFCAVWLFANITTLTIGIILRIIQNYPWYHFIVMLLTQTLYLFFACDFIFYSP